jgi:cytochrome c6
VAAGATLFTADLQRNGVGEPDSLYQLIYSGKGKMPGFGKECAPKGKCTFGPRLEDEEITALTQYVLDRAAQEWK